MDPYYFLEDLELNSNNMELHEICESYPNDDWSLISDTNNIKYKNVSYSSIIYINNQKKLYFKKKNKNKEEVVLELNLVLQ